MTCRDPPVGFGMQSTGTEHVTTEYKICRALIVRHDGQNFAVAADDASTVKLSNLPDLDFLHSVSSPWQILNPRYCFTATFPQIPSASSRSPQITNDRHRAPEETQLRWNRLRK